MDYNNETLLVTIESQDGERVPFHDKKVKVLFDSAPFSSDCSSFGRYRSFEGTAPEKLSDVLRVQVKESFKTMYKKCSDPQYMERIKEIEKQRDILLANVKKYRHATPNNPAVIALNEFNKQIADIVFDFNVYDIALGSVVITISRTKDKVVERFIDKDPDASYEKRIEYMKKAMDRSLKEEYIYIKESLIEAKEEYDDIIKIINDLLKRNNYVYLMMYFTPKDKKVIKAKEIAYSQLTFERFLYSDYTSYYLKVIKDS